MHKNRTDKNQTVFDVKIKSTVHPNVFHTIRIDLHCYERMPDEKNLREEKRATINKTKNLKQK